MGDCQGTVIDGVHDIQQQGVVVSEALFTQSSCNIDATKTLLYSTFVY